MERARVSKSLDLLTFARMEGHAEHQGGPEDDHARTEHADGVPSAVLELQDDPDDRNGGQCENEFGGHRLTPLPRYCSSGAPTTPVFS